MAPKYHLTSRSFEFPITSVCVGKKTWSSGVSGGYVTVVDDIFDVKTSKHQRETSVVGEAVDGECLTFEIHKVDYSPSSVSALIQKEQQAEMGSSPLVDGSKGDESSEDADKTPELRKNGSIGMFEAYKAYALAPRRYIKLKFKDVVRAEMTGDSMTLTLNQALHCYSKPAGKPCGTKLVAVQDFTDGARVITFRCHRAGEVHSLLRRQSARLDSLCRVKPSSSPLPEVMDVATPNRKRARDNENVDDGLAKLPRKRSLIMAPAMIRQE